MSTDPSAVSQILTLALFLASYRGMDDINTTCGSCTLEWKFKRKQVPKAENRRCQDIKLLV